MPVSSFAWTEPFRTIALTQVFVWLAFGAFVWFFSLLLRDLVRQKAIGPGLLLPLVLGMGLRLYWMVATQPAPLSDFAVYWQYANAFAQGHLVYEELSRHPAIAVLYSGFIQVWGLLASPSLWAGWVLNLLAAAAMLITLYALMREWLGARAACVALTLSAIFPQFVTYTALMATETPTVAAMLLALWALAYSRRAACSQPFWLALGVLFYGMILLRSSCLLLLILTPLAMAAFRPAVRAQALKQAAVTLGVAGLLLSSWVFHQYLIGGQAKLFWGVELWLSSAIQYDRGGRYTHPKDMAFYPRVKPYYEGGTTADLVKAYAVIGDESLAVIRRDPFKYLAFGMTRMKNILWTAQTGLRWSQKGSARMASWSPRLIKTLAVAFNVYWQILLCLSPLGLAAVLGAALPRRASVVAQDFSDAPEDASARESQRRSFAEGGALMLGFLAAWLAFHYLTAVASERYGFQIMPFALMLAVSGVAVHAPWVMARLKAIKRAVIS